MNGYFKSSQMYIREPHSTEQASQNVSSINRFFLKTFHQNVS